MEADISDKRKGRLTQIETFKYLRSMISGNGGCEEEVRHFVGPRWGNWREISGILCDKRMPLMLKVAVCKTVIRHVLMYGSETWALERTNNVEMDDGNKKV